jgi:hypothetical protein
MVEVGDVLLELWKGLAPRYYEGGSVKDMSFSVMKEFEVVSISFTESGRVERLSRWSTRMSKRCVRRHTKEEVNR